MKYLSVSLAAILLALLWQAPATAQDLEKIREQKPFAIQGSAGINLMGYAVSGIEARQQPFSFVLSAEATISLYGIEMPFSISISDKQKSYSQPFNQFGISPHYKWITLYLGYRNVTWSSYTLGGHTFLGAGADLNPGLFRFGFIWGRFDRKTTYNKTDTLNPLPEYTRKGYSVKVGVGSQKNFFDLIVLRMKDDSTSISQPDTSTITLPQQNVVTGFNSRFTIIKDFTWETEGALSLYTTNIGASEIEYVTESNFLSSLNTFLGINQSTVYNTALRSVMKFKGKGYNLKLEYKRIDPYFRSMGAYYMNNDLQNITFTPSFILFKRKVTLGGSIGLQNDNLKKTKRATSQRTIGNVILSVNPMDKFGIDFGYSNYSIRQKSGRMPLNDTTEVHQSNQSLTLTPRLMFISTTLSQSVVLNYNFTFFRDKNTFTAETGKFNMHAAQLIYVAGLLQTQWSFNAGVTLTVLDNYYGNNTGYGATLGVSKPFLDNKLNVSWNNAITRSVASGSNSFVFNSYITSSYAVAKHHNIKLNLYYTGNFEESGSASPSFNEFKGDMSYVFTF